MVAITENRASDVFLMLIHSERSAWTPGSKFLGSHQQEFEPVSSPLHNYESKFPHHYVFTVGAYLGTAERADKVRL